MMLEGHNVISLLHEVGVRAPRDCYIVTDERAHTYGEMLQSSLQRAALYSDLGVAPGDVIAIVSDRSVATVETLFALLALGANVVPLDIHEPPQRVSDLLSQVGPKLTFMSPHAVIATVSDSIAIEDIPATTRQLDFAEISTRIAGREDATAFTFFTTGSTGRPKGIELSHKAVLSGQRWLQSALKLAPDDRQLFRTTLGVTNLLREIIWPLVAGCSCCLLTDGKHNDVTEHIEAIDRHSVTVIGTVPILVEALVSNRRSAASLGSLRHVICTSDVFLDEQLERISAALPHAKIYNVYGLTETPYVAYFDCAHTARNGKQVPIGIPADLSPIVLDDNLSQAAKGVPGRLYVHGVGMFSRYWNNPELTGSRFIEFDGRRLFDTGDIASVGDDGLIRLVGRSEYLVKIGGYRVEVSEIEDAIRGLDQIAEACVIPFEIGNGTKRLAAWIVPQAGSRLTEASVRHRLGKAVKPYMVPAVIKFTDTLPRTHNGKIDKKLLERQLYDKPEKSQETGTLVDIVQSVLNVSRINLSDNIIALGGDSISALLISVRAHEIGLTIDPTVLLSCTIAEAIASGTWGNADDAPPADALETDPMESLLNYGWSERDIRQLASTIHAVAS